MLTRCKKRAITIIGDVWRHIAGVTYPENYHPAVLRRQGPTTCNRLSASLRWNLQPSLNIADSIYQTSLYCS